MGAFFRACAVENEQSEVFEPLFYGDGRTYKCEVFRVTRHATGVLYEAAIVDIGRGAHYEFELFYRVSQSTFSAPGALCHIVASHAQMWLKNYFFNNRHQQDMSARRKVERRFELE